MKAEEILRLRNQGELPNGLTVDDIIKGTSMPRNLFLFTNANFLLPYTGAGSGIIQALEDRPDVMFENRVGSHEFVIIVKKKSNQENNQESNQESNQKSNQESNQEKLHNHLITKKQKDIVNFCSVPRSSKEILDRIGVSNQSANRRRHILPLVEMGFLEMTNPDNPNDRNQKYRKKRTTIYK